MLVKRNDVVWKRHFESVMNEYGRENSGDSYSKAVKMNMSMVTIYMGKVM